MVLAACKKNNPAPNYGKVNVTISHQVDGVPVLFDTIAYVNQAGNRYSVERLQYYLCDFRIYKQGKLYHSGKEVNYIDARIDSLCVFSISLTTGLIAGQYDSVAFCIGVDSSRNIAYGLPATLQNIDMEWPQEMGGGYHFLKLEGHWIDGSQQSGYAMHLGQNAFLVSAGARCNLNIPRSGNASLSLTMNINEWFKNPYLYNFSTDGVFSMGDSVLMEKLSENGRDVFYGN